MGAIDTREGDQAQPYAVGSRRPRSRHSGDWRLEGGGLSFAEVTQALVLHMLSA
ncbi:hypothetical protein [Undibacterium sp.]|uniref:hypothetical protein n=1 Tax=Undibacterium sp. TaxID=1914977 RepID=UPI00272F007B|nr:hypothetical protein [Undibacterium sp.]MDP1980882.1 hypothetical protein [Undibacterium sp.]